MPSLLFYPEYAIYLFSLRQDCCLLHRTLLQPVIILFVDLVILNKNVSSKALSFILVNLREVLGTD